MDQDAQERFEKVELRLSEQDEKIIAQDRSLTAVRNLLRTGISMLVDMEGKMAALTDSEGRLYGSLQELADKVQELAGKVQELADSQRRTDESLRRFLDRSGNGHSS